MLRPNTYLTKRTRARARRASKGASTTAARRACLAQLGPPEPDEVWVAGGDGAAEHCCSAPRAGGGDLLDGQELPRKIVERLHGTSAHMSYLLRRGGLTLRPIVGSADAALDTATGPADGRWAVAAARRGAPTVAL